MHNREYTVFLRPYKGAMMLHTMYYKEEVKDLDNFGAPDVELKDAEIKVAHQLIEALAGDFEPEKYHDTFEENVKALIKARLEGEEVTPVEKPKKMAPVVDLMAALKESLAQLPKKPPQRVEAAESASEVKTVAKGKKASKKKPAA
jgi:DNA end-binding protein Ku